MTLILWICRHINTYATNNHKSYLRLLCEIIDKSDNENNFQEKWSLLKPLFTDDKIIRVHRYSRQSNIYNVILLETNSSYIQS